MSQQRFEELLSGLLDQDLTESEFGELQSMLAGSAEYRRLYWEYVELHSSLEVVLDTPAQTAVVQQACSKGEQLLRQQSRRAFKMAALGAVAVALVAALVLQLILVENNPNLAAFETSPNTRYTVTNTTDGKVDHIQTGDIVNIQQGMMELQFEKGVRAVVSGPATFSLTSDSELKLDEGIAWFHVPQEAVGFTVVTPKLKVIDLGTDFGVKHLADSDPEVHVFTGKVLASSTLGNEEEITVSEGDAFKLDDKGNFQAITPTQTAFHTELSDHLPYLHWSFDAEDGFQATGTHSALSGLETTSKHGARLTKKGFLALNGNKQYLLTNWKGLSGDRPRSVSFRINLTKSPQGQGNPGIIAWGSDKHKLGRWKVAVQQAANEDEYHIRITFGAYRLISTEALNTGQWHQVTLGYDGIDPKTKRPRARLSIDGKESTLRTDVSSLNGDFEFSTITDNPASKELRIGSTIHSKEGSAYYIHGKIDDLYLIDGYLPPATLLRNVENPQE